MRVIANRHLICLVYFLLAAAGGGLQAQKADRGPDIQSRQSTAIAGTPSKLEVSPTFPVVSKEEMERREVPTESHWAPEPPSGRTTPVFGPPELETVDPLTVPLVGIKIWRDVALSPPRTLNPNHKPAVAWNNEPAVANSGKSVFYTGNWYAARSSDGGTTWAYVDPSKDFPDFCCDQDVIYDKSRDVLFWIRLGKLKTPENPKKSQFRIGASTDGGTSFCFWNWSPGDFSPDWATTDVSFDYPQLALANNHLYLTINLYDKFNTPRQSRYFSVLARTHLDTLRACGKLTWTYWRTAEIPAYYGCYSASDKAISPPLWTPAQGSRDSLYLGQTTTNSCVTVWRQQEAGTALEQYRVAVPAWEADPAALTCRVKAPPGSASQPDPCLGTDSRVRAGWTAQGVVGFLWSAGRNVSKGFPYPYINAATFHTSDLSYKDRPYIWSKTNAWTWAAAYPNDRGDVAVGLWKMNSTTDPQLYVGINDDFTGASSPWQMQQVVSSTASLTGSNWGHYLRVRQHAPAGLGWILSGFVAAKKGSDTVVEPHFVIFGRDRDEWSVKRWWAQ